MVKDMIPKSNMEKRWSSEVNNTVTTNKNNKNQEVEEKEAKGTQYAKASWKWLLMTLDSY